MFQSVPGRAICKISDFRQMCNRSTLTTSKRHSTLPSAAWNLDLFCEKVNSSPNHQDWVLMWVFQVETVCLQSLHAFFWGGAHLNIYIYINAILHIYIYIHTYMQTYTIYLYTNLKKSTNILSQLFNSILKKGHGAWR